MKEALTKTFMTCLLTNHGILNENKGVKRMQGGWTMVYAIIGFMILESLNVLLLYFDPGSKRGNGVGVFRAWEKSKKDPEIHAFVQYLVNWVAGTKLIFIALLLVILLTGTRTTQIFALAALIVSILSFYWRLYPMIKVMDKAGSIEPSGYSKTLGTMIAGFIAVFGLVLVLSL